MADIELVIKIDEEVYKRLKSLSTGDNFEHDIYGNCMRRIAKGTPLPKGYRKKLKTDVIDMIRAEIEQKIEQERFARSVFRGEEKEAVKAEQCTGSIFAYNNVIELIDKYKAENEDK